MPCTVDAIQVGLLKATSHQSINHNSFQKITSKRIQTCMRECARAFIDVHLP